MPRATWAATSRPERRRKAGPGPEGPVARTGRPLQGTRWLEAGPPVGAGISTRHSRTPSPPGTAGLRGGAGPVRPRPRGRDEGQEGEGWRQEVGRRTAQRQVPGRGPEGRGSGPPAVGRAALRCRLQSRDPDGVTRPQVQSSDARVPSRAGPSPSPGLPSPRLQGKTSMYSLLLQFSGDKQGPA